MEKDLIFDTESVKIEDTSRALTIVEKLQDNMFLRKFLIIAAFAALWQFAAMYENNPLAIATFTDAMKAFWDSLTTSNPDGQLMNYVVNSMQGLLSGFAIGIVIAVIATVIAVNSRLGEEVLHTLTALFTPLPAVGILPVALLVFGISFKTIVFVAAWATIFPLAENMLMGFKTSSKAILNVGRNIGLKGIAFTMKVRIPDTLPAILTGLSIGFSNSFRALIALELVIGAGTGSGGLGWFIMNGKNQMDAPTVFAGLLVTMLIGLIFKGVFEFIAKHTVKKYGMMR